MGKHKKLYYRMQWVLASRKPRNPNKIDYSGDLPTYFHSFEVIEDPRTGGNKRHHFGGILFMATSAMLCGLNGFADSEHFCEIEEEWLREWIEIPQRNPMRADFFEHLRDHRPRPFQSLPHRTPRHSHAASGGQRHRP